MSQKAIPNFFLSLCKYFMSNNFVISETNRDFLSKSFDNVWNFRT